MLALALTAGACGGDNLAVPCPKPPDLTVPAVETVGVGAVVNFAVPASQVRAGGRIQWSSNLKTVATVPLDVGRATAQGVGSAIIMAVDLNTAPNCPDFWQGVLVVR
ncbi:MAG: hypothetical protein ABJF01_14590 [bacterium]